MPQHELQIKNATQDPVTGFLSFPPEPCSGKSFNAQVKTEFLKVYALTGDQSKAMAACGFSNRILGSHLKVDKEFAAAYRETLFEMESRLTGTMYQNALTPKGTLDRFGWLRAHNPAKWAPKAANADYKPDKQRIDELFKDAIDITPVTDTNPPQIEG